MRLDMDIDGQNNSVYEVNSHAEPMDKMNYYGNTFYTESTLLETEQAAQRIVDPFTVRY
jgi:primary-amine oxidase